MDNISINITGSPAEQASSTILTDAASVITPIRDRIKLFSLVNFCILVNILFLFLSSTTLQPLVFLSFINALILINDPIIASLEILPDSIYSSSLFLYNFAVLTIFTLVE